MIEQWFYDFFGKQLGQVVLPFIIILGVAFSIVLFIFILSHLDRKGKL